jgi:hypothetical protein
MFHWYCKATYNLGQFFFQNNIQFGTEGVIYYLLLVLVSLAQLVGTMHKICKVRGSIPRHHQKYYLLTTI